MKEHIVYFILLCMFTIFLYAGYMQATVYGKDKLKFSTEKIRAMWFMCAAQFKTVAPTIPQLERVRLCDCYVDHMRSTFTPEQVIALSPEQSKELGLKMNIICPTHMPFSFKEGT